jgi:outer membrane protein assembly factor BamB
MKNKNMIYISLLVFFFYTNISAQMSVYVPDTYSSIRNEEGLLKSWPKNGPELLWKYENIGNGYSSPVFTSDGIFVTGEIKGVGYLFAFDSKGTFQWKQEYGKEWSDRFPGSRSTPTVVNNLIYVCSGLGNISCFDSENGNKKWSVEMINDLNGTNIIYGYSMSPVVDEDLLFCSPGGEESNIVALNRFTGEVVWVSKAKGELPGYGSPIIVKLPTRKILVAFTEYALLGLDTKDGKLLWSHKLSDYGEIPCNQPIYEAGYIYYVAGAGNGAGKLKLSDDGTTISEIWINEDFDTYFGGFCKVGNFIYGSSQNQRVWKSLDTNTGKETGELDFNKGASISANGMLYFYNERGQMGLVKPNGGKPELISSFKIDQGTREHFAFPAINKGKLYIRHGNVLLAYNISEE